MCQTCIDEGNISETTTKLIEDFTDEWPRSEFGPAHIVLADWNIEDSHIKWCIMLIDVIMSGDASKLNKREKEMMEVVDWWRDHDIEEFIATKEFLLKLLEIPEEKR
jgi:hypothetical protein